MIRRGISHKEFPGVIEIANLDEERCYVPK